jgi:hypothetical protein
MSSSSQTPGDLGFKLVLSRISMGELVIGHKDLPLPRLLVLGVLDLKMDQKVG